MLVLPNGGKGIGVEAEGSNFPFVQPSDDVVGLLADLWLTYEYQQVPLPLSVSKLVGFQEAFDGLPSAAQIQIVDARKNVLFDSSGAKYYWKPWPPRLRVHEWAFAGAICRVVQHCAVPDASWKPWPETIVPANGTLDERTSEPMSQRLLVVSEAATGVAATGAIEFINGWNVDIVDAPYIEPLRNTTLLTFSANPGGGPGRFPGCKDPSPGIRSINTIKPNPQGDFAVAAGQCYFARQPVNIVGGKAVPVPATLALGNDCGPCCECDDFVSVQKAILKIEAELRAAGATAEATRDQLDDAIVRWNDQKACREKQAVSVGAATTASIYADISIAICNPTDTCLTEVQVDFTVATQTSGGMARDEPTLLAGPWSVVPGSTYILQSGQKTLMPYQLTGPVGGTLTAHLDAIDPANAGRIRTRIVWSNQQAPGTMLTVTAKVTTPSNTVLFPQSGTFTVLMT